jgi:hypothetical protein
VLVGAALSGVTILLIKIWLPGVLAAGVAAMGAIVAGVWTSRGTSALTERDKLLRGLPGMILRRQQPPYTRTRPRPIGLA